MQEASNLASQCDRLWTSPREPAVSKSPRCSFVGIVFHCIMTAAPRHRRICSSISVTALLSSRFPTASSLESTCREWINFSKLSASQSSFWANKPKLFTDRSNSRISPGTSVFFIDSALSAAFVRKCSAVNIKACASVTRVERVALNGAAMSGYWMLQLHMGTLTSNYDDNYAIPGNG